MTDKEALEHIIGVADDICLLRELYVNGIIIEDK